MIHHQQKQLNSPPSGHAKENLASMKVSGQKYIKWSTGTWPAASQKEGHVAITTSNKRRKARASRSTTTKDKAKGSPETKLRGISCLFPVSSAYHRGQEETQKLASLSISQTHYVLLPNGMK